MMMDGWKPLALRARMPARAIKEMERFADEMLAGRAFRAYRR